jgi:hypothetical protein
LRDTHEKIQEAGHAHQHAGAQGVNTRIAVLISVLAALLALTQAGGKNAQNNALNANIENSDLWAFFQAKTARITTLSAAADSLELLAPAGLPPQSAEAVRKRIADWRSTAQRYDSEPATGEGRAQLRERAARSAQQRDHFLHSYHLYEYGAAALELGIVMASAAVVTGVIAMAWIAGALGMVGIGLALLA